MRLDAHAVHRAARNRHLTESMKFTLYRWIELVEPSNHFSLGASSLIDPLTTCRELREAITEMVAGSGVKPGEVLERSESVRKTIAMNSRIAQWYPSERNAVRHALLTAEQTTPSQRRKGEHPAAFQARREKVARIRFSPILGNELAQFEAILTQASGGYLEHLLDEVANWLVYPPTALKEWRHLDHALEWLGAHALEQGRDHHVLAMAAIRAFEQATSTHDAVSRFSDAFLAPPRSFVVAVSIQGVRRLRGAARFGTFPVVIPPVWPAGTPAENRRLENLLDAARDRRRGSACVACVRCDALDEGDATRQALATVGQLVDHICAEHPATDISLGASTLTLDEGNRSIRDTSPRLRSIDQARTQRPNPELARSLRFYGMARQETVPVVSVLHTWIALEDLAAGVSKPMPGLFVQPNAAAAVALAAARAQLTTPFKELKFLAKKNHQKTRWKRLEDWLGVRPFGPAVPLDPWLRLLSSVPTSQTAPVALTPGDSQADAAAHLWDLADKLGPFARYRLEEVANRLRNSGELANWFAESRNLASLQLTRMRFLRHAAVHRARHHDEAAQQLAVAAHDIADAVYEVIPHWLTGSNRPWEALRDARRHYEQLLKGWSGTSGRPQIDPDRLVHP